MSATHGLGWKWFADTRKIALLFEIDGICQNENGAPEVGGVALKIGPLKEQPDVAKVEETVRHMTANGVPHFEGRKATPITWETYCDLYAEEP